MTLGDSIRIYREKKGLNQSELAAAAGYKTRSSITKIEKNENIPSPQKILAIADALEVGLIDLIKDVPPESIGENNYQVVVAMASQRQKETASKSEMSAIQIQHTDEAKIIYSFIDGLPAAEREKLLSVLRAMYPNHPELFKTLHE